MTPSEVVSSSLSLHRGLVRICEGRVQLAVEQSLYFLTWFVYFVTFVQSHRAKLDLRHLLHSLVQSVRISCDQTAKVQHAWKQLRCAQKVFLKSLNFVLKLEQGSLAAPSLQKRSSWARQSSSSPAPRTGTRRCTSSSDRPCWPRPSTLPPPTRNVRLTKLFLNSAALCFLKLFYTLCYDTVKNLF